MGYYDDLNVNPKGLCLELNLYDKHLYNLHLFYHTAPIGHSPAKYELALMAIKSKYKFYYKTKKSYCSQIDLDSNMSPTKLIPMTYPGHSSCCTENGMDKLEIVSRGQEPSAG